jgi:antitoxin (DNA-binding transcriptional repressor) of toxin-antitoxin stability system
MSTTRIDLTEICSKLPDLIVRVRNGDEVSITQDGEVVALLIPAEDPNRRRALGMFRGRIWMSPDFNDPLTEEELQEWGL